MTFSNDNMTMALVEAEAAAERGEVPVGAVIIHGPSGKVMARAGNRVIADSDPTAHAEIIAIRAACAQMGSERLRDCDLYVSLEPCPMCAQAISLARLRRLYFAAYDEKNGAVDNGLRVFQATSCHHKPEIYGGMSEAKAAKMLKDFFSLRR